MRSVSTRARAALLVATVLVAACGADADGDGGDEGDDAATTTTAAALATTTTGPGTATMPGEAVVLAAGDIAACAVEGDEATAELIGQRPDALVLTLGDNVYDDGTAQQFAECFDPSWGRFRDRIRPVPGNHDFQTTGAAGYFEYFGPIAGEPGRGWYSFDAGAWHIIALNSVCSVAGCGPDSEQVAWLGADLEAHRDTRCTLAYWHHPRFSSGRLHGSDPDVDVLWRAVHDAGVDVVLAGHEHNYERFAPLDADGNPAESGIRSFVVGTGGRSHYAGFRDPPVAGSEVRDGSTFGLLELTLRADGYDWEFVPAGGTFTDSGTASCR